MKYKLILLFLLLSQLYSLGQGPRVSTEQYKEDFNFFWTSINNEYCYFAKKQTDWQKVKEMYSPMVDTITSRDCFVAILEKMLIEIYDHHAILNTNTDSSRRLVPSRTDIWAEYVNGKPVITEVRKNLGAGVSGITAGMEVIAVNDIPVEAAIQAFLPKALPSITTEAKSFALRLLLAGNHILPRKFTLNYRGVSKEYFPDQTGLLLENINYAAKVESKLIDNIGYIKINDCLYDNELIPVFDSVMQTMKNTRSLILDLRETPSGGNTTVARAIIGWFVNKEHFYQKHEYYAEEKSFGVKSSWEEIVSPRKDKYYGKPLVILCDHWTGSIAEGITIGFDALKRPGTEIIGTAMAALNGAVYSYEMPNTKIHFTFPAERLYHINGLPREQYIPPVFINWQKDTKNPNADSFMAKALEYLKSK
ncbi:MAG: S41 family peptidase [Bacteroidota bacterium]|nr:S41 family peptidase [Bacteroidota bacterium]